MLNTWSCGLVLAFVLFGGAVASSDEGEGPDSFAEINGQVVTVGELAERLRAEYRKKFYHGQPPAEEVEAFQDEIMQRVIDEVLLIQEAIQRGVTAETIYMDEQFKARTAELTEEQLAEQVEFVGKLKRRIEEERLLELLEESVRDAVLTPSNESVMDYYRTYPEKFTTPAKDHVKIILLGVPAYSGSESWAAAREKASDLLRELRAGADFSEMAMIHSSDESAPNGGDMGFQPAIRLAPEYFEAIKGKRPDHITPPVRTQFGYHIIKVLAVKDVKSINTALYKKVVYDQKRDKILDGYFAGMRKAAAGMKNAAAGM